MPPSGKSEIFRRAAAAARAAREIFCGGLFCLNFMYFLRFEHDFHVQAKLYPPGMLRACSMRIRGRGARAPHHATTAPRHAHPRAQLAEYAMIPPLIILIRWHGAMHALPTGSATGTRSSTPKSSTHRVVAACPAMSGAALVQRGSGLG